MYLTDHGCSADKIQGSRIKMLPTRKVGDKPSEIENSFFFYLRRDSLV